MGLPPWRIADTSCHMQILFWESYLIFTKLHENQKWNISAKCYFWFLSLNVKISWVYDVASSGFHSRHSLATASLVSHSLHEKIILTIQNTKYISDICRSRKIRTINFRKFPQCKDWGTCFQVQRAYLIKNAFAKS